jgi:hypothetical protein
MPLDIYRPTRKQGEVDASSPSRNFLDWRKTLGSIRVELGLQLSASGTCFSSRGSPSLASNFPSQSYVSNSMLEPCQCRLPPKLGNCFGLRMTRAEHYRCDARPVASQGTSQKIPRSLDCEIILCHHLLLALLLQAASILEASDSTRPIFSPKTWQKSRRIFPNESQKLHVAHELLVVLVQPSHRARATRPTTIGPSSNSAYVSVWSDIYHNDFVIVKAV